MGTSEARLPVGSGPRAARCDEGAARAGGTEDLRNLAYPRGSQASGSEQPGACARDLPGAMAPTAPAQPHSSLNVAALELGNVAMGGAAGSVVSWLPWVRIAEVRGSKPLSSTSTGRR
jgi:hypothetical protein